MQAKNAQKLLSRYCEIARLGNGMWCGRIGDRVIDLSLDHTGGEVSYVRVRRVNDHDDLMSDYHAGSFFDNLTAAIRYCIGKSKNQHLPGSQTIKYPWLEAEIVHEGNTLKKTAVFRLTYNRTPGLSSPKETVRAGHSSRCPVPLAMAEAYIAGDDPGAGILLDWLSEKVGGDIGAAVDEVRMAHLTSPLRL